MRIITWSLVHQSERNRIQGLPPSGIKGSKLSYFNLTLIWREVQFQKLIPKLIQLPVFKLNIWKKWRIIHFIRNTMENVRGNDLSGGKSFHHVIYIECTMNGWKGGSYFDFEVESSSGPTRRGPCMADGVCVCVGTPIWIDFQRAVSSCMFHFIQNQDHKFFIVEKSEESLSLCNLYWVKEPLTDGHTRTCLAK